MSTMVEAIVVGATGYVGGELLRLLASHPRLSLLAACSESRAGEAIGKVFPHLEASFPDRIFESIAALDSSSSPEPLAVFSAANHGESASRVASLLRRFQRSVHVVDLSADFRFSSTTTYQAVYGHPHPAPDLLDGFRCAVPEHARSADTPHIAHPGCFTTAALLAIVPLLDERLVEPELFVTGVTGSTGAGTTPKETTHHPVRHANLFAYNPLAHRHAPEMEALAEAAVGERPTVHFIPHSGPFSRGIHVTVQARLRGAYEATTVRDALERYYSKAPFVRVVEGTPRLKDVVGSNYARIGAAVDGQSVAVFSVIDNLLKGAAGGAVQWMNRLLGFPEDMGLVQSPAGWI
ncbi:MAG TPA: N-acetyl-gamma-glutamyl-phosphate reductase [Vicinamibacteria bacterium]|nr:N-acetyl-gamma-glutamyl-phosphate reductase [Vicinamibacteria bacterium]